MKNPASNMRKMMLTFFLTALVGVVPQLNAQTLPRFEVSQIAEDPDLPAGAPLPFLFAIGPNNQVWVHEFDGFGNPSPRIGNFTQVGGYMLIPDQVKAISASRDSAGNPLLFVIGTDSQVYVHQFYGGGNANGTGHPIGSYMLIPGQVNAISVGRDSAGNPLLYVIGTDYQVWVHRFDGSGNPVGSYMPIPCQVKAISVSHDSAGNPLLFVIGTDYQVWVHRFAGSGNPVGSYMLIPNLQVKAISAGHDSAGNPLLFVIGTDNQVHVNHLDPSGNPVGGYTPIPCQVKAISVGRDSAGNPLLFVIGTDSQVYVHRFDGFGNPVGGYMLIPCQVKAITVGRDGAGKPLLWVIGTDNQVYVHQFDGSGNPVGSYVLVQFGISTDFIEQIQLESLWCWDATTVSITQYYEPATTWTQGSLADHVFGQTTCTTNGASSLCNRGSDLGADLMTTNHLSSSSSGSVPLSVVMTEIQAGRPIGITIQWNGGGEHDIVIDGFDFSNPSSPTIHVQDPWNGPATQDFNTFPSQYWGGATWIYTYFTK